MAMASCHSLMHLDSGVVGDPMEKALLNSVDWDVGKGIFLHIFSNLFY